MTTVVYLNGAFAADTAMSTEDSYCGKVDKLFELPCGAIVGFSGETDFRDAVDLFSKIRSPDKLPSREELCDLKFDFTCILVFPNRRAFIIYANEPSKDGRGDWESGVNELKEGYAAVGSGQKYALGALAVGATALAAVKVAAKFDKSTRGPFTTLTVGPVRKARGGRGKK